MTVAPVSLVDALNARLSDDAGRLAADDRVRVLHEILAAQLGPLLGQATCDVEDLARVFPTLGRSSRYELARRLPGVQVGRRRLVSVVGVASLLLGCEPALPNATNGRPDQAAVVNTDTGATPPDVLLAE